MGRELKLLFTVLCRLLTYEGNVLGTRCDQTFLLRVNEQLRQVIVCARTRSVRFPTLPRN